MITRSKHLGLLLISLLFLAACSNIRQNQPAVIETNDNQLHGVIEFYCTHCIAGFAVYKIENNREINLVHKTLGRKIKDTIETPSRIKRARISLPAGSHRLKIDLLPTTLLGSAFDVLNGPSKEIEITVLADTLQPIRLEFLRKNTNSFTWLIKPGQALPRIADPKTFKTLIASLYDPIWETRWVATQVWGKTNATVPIPAQSRIQTLSGRHGAEECLENAAPIECALLREAAIHTTRQLKDNGP